MVQNKLHFAIHGHTAEEGIIEEWCMNKPIAFKALLQGIAIDDIWSYLELELRCWLVWNVEFDASNVLELISKLYTRYSHILEELKKTEPEPQDCDRLVVINWMDNGESDFRALGFKQKNPQERYDLSHIQWPGWLGLPESVKSLKRYGLSQFAAACLLEMTFLGLTIDDVKKRAEEVNEQLWEAENSREDAIPHEEVMQRMEDLFGLEHIKKTPEEEEEERQLMEKEWRENMALWATLVS